MDGDEKKIQVERKKILPAFRNTKIRDKRTIFQRKTNWQYEWQREKVPSKRLHKWLAIKEIELFSLVLREDGGRERGTREKNGKEKKAGKTYQDHIETILREPKSQHSTNKKKKRKKKEHHCKIK